jgi:hypothetical protein
MKKSYVFVSIFFFLLSCSQGVDIQPQPQAELEHDVEADFAAMIKKYNVVDEDKIEIGDEIEIRCSAEVWVTGLDGYCWGFSSCQRRFMFWGIG